MAFITISVNKLKSSTTAEVEVKDAIWYNKQPIKASPAPVVSTVLTSILGMIFCFLFVLSNVPFFPNVMVMISAPILCNLQEQSIGLVSPESNCASSKLNLHKCDF